METEQEDKRLHLQMIQAVIDRMASNSFIIKGWSLTAFGGLFTLYIANQEKSWSYELLWLVLVCALIFWWHDTYYLKIERQYRDLYEIVSKKKNTKINFSMKPPKTSEAFICVAFRPILVGSYGIIVLTTVFLLYKFK